MKFTDVIFDSNTNNSALRVPITRYQDYTQKRYRVDTSFDQNSDYGRFTGLMWYIENYCALRGEMQAPLSASQIRFLNEAPAAGIEPFAIPRILEYYWRRDIENFGNPYLNLGRLQDMSYWWCIEKAPELGVERVLVPEILIDILMARSGPLKPVPPSEFLVRIAQRHTGRWSFDSETERLACYIDVLFHRRGLYYALFFPPEVINGLRNIGKYSDPQEQTNNRLVGREMFDAVRRRAEAAARYRSRHIDTSRGKRPISAARISRPWNKPLGTAPQQCPLPQSTLDCTVRVIGPIHSQSGLGQATRLSIDALTLAGIKFQTLDFHLDNPAPRSIIYPDNVAEDVSPSINFIHLNAESIPLAAAYLDERLFKNSYNIGYFFWELPQPALCHELALSQLDEVWVSSEFNRDIYKNHTSAPVTKVGMAVEALDASHLLDRQAVRDKFCIPANVTAFLTTFDAFSFMRRKNPAGALRAFLEAFPNGEEPVALVIKTHNLYAPLGEFGFEALRNEIVTLVEQDPRIILINETLPHEILLSLKSACDCYVSLHRSEGWGFGIIESMQVGLPVIATGFSGNTEFCLDETAYIVSFEKKYLEKDDYIFVRAGDYWAEPSISKAAEFMRDITLRPCEAKAKAAAAYDFIQANFSKAEVGKRYLNRLKEICAGISHADAELQSI